MFQTGVQPPIAQAVIAPPTGPNAAYGKYLVAISGCRDCHGEKLTGSSGGLGPAGPNITVEPPKWTDADFANLFRSGKLPYGKNISNDDMPWKDFSTMFSDDDIKAISAYIHTLTPAAGGQ